MNHFVLAITGPAGSGKSTVAEKLAKQLDRCVNIDVDHVKHMVVSGFFVDKSNPENPSGWRFSQWDLVGDSIGVLAANFAKNGYNVIINGYIDPPGWAKIDKQIHITKKVLLLPELSKVVERDAARPQDFVMGQQSVAKHHKAFSNDRFYDDFTKLDTTKHSIDETVEAIREMLH